MSDLTERLKLLIEANADGAIKQLKAVGDGAEAQVGGKGVDALKKFTGNSSMVTGALGKVQNAISSISAPVAIAGAGFAAAGLALAKFAFDGVEQFSAVTLEVTQFQRATSASAEDSSKLVFALKELGVPADNLVKGFFKLEQTVGRGKDKLDEYGVSVARNKDGSFNLTGTIENMAVAFQKTQDPAKRSAMLFDAFGRAGASMAVILGQSKDKLKELFAEAGKDHQIFSQEDLQRGIEYRESLESLHSAFQGVEIEVGQALVPTLTKLASTLTSTIHGIDSLAKSGGGIGGLFHSLASAAAPFLDVVDLVGKSSDKSKTSTDGLSRATSSLSDSLSEGGVSSENAAAAAMTLEQAEQLAGQSTANMTDKQKEQVKAAQDQLTAFQNLQNAVASTISSDIAYTQSQLGVQQALNSLAKATKDNADAKGLDADKALALKQAQDGLTQSIQSEATAAAKKAQDDLGPNATATQKAIAGHQAYEAELNKLSTSSIPAVRFVAGLLLQQAQQYDRTWTGTFTANTTLADASINELIAKGQTWSQLYHQGLVYGPPVPGKAVGGPVSGNKAYLVGEKGPELFVPKSSGTVVPNDALMGGVGRPVSMGGGTTYQISVNVGPSADKASVGAAVVDAIKQYERRSGTAWRS